MTEGTRIRKQAILRAAGIVAVHSSDPEGCSLLHVVCRQPLSVIRSIRSVVVSHLLDPFSSAADNQTQLGKGGFRNALSVVVACLGILIVPASGQTTVGSIFGTVTDQSGGVIPDTTITAIDVNTGLVRTTRSNSSGNYLFPSVSTGDYNITAQAKGFTVETIKSLHVDANQSANATFKLPVGSESETVTVTSEAALIDTRESQLGETVDRKRIQDLPLDGRNVSSLVQLVAGVNNYTPQAQGGDQNGDAFSVNGGRTNENTFYLDGAFDTSLFNV